MIALAPTPRAPMIARASDPTRRPSGEARGDWVGFVYRGAFYALAGTPVWGAALTFLVVWRHAHP